MQVDVAFLRNNPNLCLKKIIRTVENMELSHLLHNISSLSGKEFTCKFCNRSFEYKHLLKNHELIHLFPYECTICCKRFTRSHHLQTHMVLHNLEEVSVGTNPKNSNFEHSNFRISELRTPRTYLKNCQSNSNLRVRTSNFLCSMKYS